MLNAFETTLLLKWDAGSLSAFKMEFFARIVSNWKALYIFQQLPEGVHLGSDRVLKST